MPHAREFRAALIAGDPAKAAEWAKGWQYAGYKMTIFSSTEEKVIEDNILHAQDLLPHAVRADDWQGPASPLPRSTSSPMSSRTAN